MSPANKPRIVNFQAEYAKHADFTRPACVPIRRYRSVVCEIAFGEPLKTLALQAVRSYWETWRERSTAQTDFTAHRNNKGQRKYLCAVFNISAFETESARRFSSGLMANPEFLLAKKHVPQVPQDGRGSYKPGAAAEMRFTRTLDVTELAVFADHRNLQPASCQFSTGLGVRSDLQQAAPERDGDCMGSIVGLKFVHQVLDMEINRALCNRKVIGNLLVAIAIANESKNLQFPCRKVVVTQVLGETSRHVGWNMPAAGVN